MCLILWPQCSFWRGQRTIWTGTYKEKTLKKKITHLPPFFYIFTTYLSAVSSIQIFTCPADPVLSCYDQVKQPGFSAAIMVLNGQRKLPAPFRSKQPAADVCQLHPPDAASPYSCRHSILGGWGRRHVSFWPRQGGRREHGGFAGPGKF